MACSCLKISTGGMQDHVQQGMKAEWYIAASSDQYHSIKRPEDYRFWEFHACPCFYKNKVTLSVRFSTQITCRMQSSSFGGSARVQSGIRRREHLSFLRPRPFDPAPQRLQVVTLRCSYRTSPPLYWLLPLVSEIKYTTLLKILDKGFTIFIPKQLSYLPSVVDGKVVVTGCSLLILVVSVLLVTSIRVELTSETTAIIKKRTRHSICQV